MYRTRILIVFEHRLDNAILGICLELKEKKSHENTSQENKPTSSGGNTFKGRNKKLS